MVKLTFAALKPKRCYLVISYENFWILSGALCGYLFELHRCDVQQRYGGGGVRRAGYSGLHLHDGIQARMWL